MREFFQAVADALICGDLWKLNPNLLFKTNPCRKCIVKACCSFTCRERRDYELLCWPFKTAIYNKMTLLFIYGSAILIGGTLVYSLFIAG